MNLTETKPAETTATAMSTSSTAFNKNASSFVPKGKIVKTTEEFPSLDMGLAAAPKKKVVVPV